MKLIKIKPQIYAIVGPTKSLAKTFVRFQEYYENPYFSGSVFTLDEFKAWYKAFTKQKTFTYYEDWSGFNVPDWVLAPFRQGKFDPLSKDETWLLKELSKIKDSKFYVMGYSSGDKTTLKHELAHAFYYVDWEYKSKVDAYLKKQGSGLINLKNHLKSISYGDATLLDECHAYLLCEKKYLKSHDEWFPKYEEHKKVLTKIFNKKVKGG
jgi:hypothetical protein